MVLNSAFSVKKNASFESYGVYGIISTYPWGTRCLVHYACVPMPYFAYTHFYIHACIIVSMLIILYTGTACIRG